MQSHPCAKKALLTLCICLATTPSFAEYTMDELLAMDLSELMNIQVNLASRSEQSQFATPAAVYVLTQEDIRRSGLRSIPELLRLVPGLFVGKIDANKWAINARDSAAQFSGAMLVMMDGRTLYDPLFAGTFWEVQDYVLADIERIEIIRGPGGTLWGANAVNGIINIVTKNSSSTQGSYVHAGAGVGEIKEMEELRHGFSHDNLQARVYAKNRRTDHGEIMASDVSNNSGSAALPVGSDATDDGQLQQAGFRLDWALADQQTMKLQGDIYDGELHDIRRGGVPTAYADNNIAVHGGNVLWGWNRRYSETSELVVTTYFDTTQREDLGFNSYRETLDFDLQHSFVLAEQHLTWGLSARRTEDETSTGPGTAAHVARFTLNPPSRSDHVHQLFIQDQLWLIEDKLQLTLGSKAEHNDYTGSEYQPGLRLAYLPNDQQTWWLATTRAVRTPSRGDHNAYLNFNSSATCSAALGRVVVPELGGCVQFISDPEKAAMIVNSVELGYRQLLETDTSFDLAGYYDEYNPDPLDVAPPLGVPDAIYEDHSYGVEMDLRHSLTDQWRLEFWYAQIHKYSNQADGTEFENHGVPRHTAHLRSYWDLTPSVQFDVLAYYTDGTKNPGASSLDMPHTTRLDMHWGWTPLANMNLDLTLSNITNDVHAEELESTRLNTGVNRGVYVSMSYQFDK